MGPGPSRVGSAVGDAGPAGMGSLLCQRVTRELDPRYITARGQRVPRRLPPDALLPADALRRPLRRHLPRHPALPAQLAASGGQSW